MTEDYPSDWKRVVLMVAPDGTAHAIGGDRIDGDARSDLPYYGLERIENRYRSARVEAFREAERVEPASVRCPIHTAVPVGAPCFWGYCCHDRWRAALRAKAEES